jgi:acyl-coenzyme A synthetase/AMP-(fatty) acid ligase
MCSPTREVRFLPELPKARPGKIHKAVLRDG